MKKIIAMLLACLLSFAMLAGCATKEATETTTETTEPDAVETADAQTTGEEGSELNIWLCQWGSENYETAIDEIAQNATQANINGKNYDVNAKMISWDGFYETFLTAYTSGTGPNIATEANTSPIMYYLQDSICDLMPIYEAWVEEENPILDQIPQEYFDFFTVDGKLIAMPFGCDVQGVVYNKELLADIGFEGELSTWNDVLDACALLKEKYPDKMGFLFAADTPASASNFGTWFLRQHNATYRSLDHRGNLTSERATLALNNFKALMDEGYVNEAVLTYTTDDIHRIFLNDEALFCVTGMPTWIADGSTEKYGFLQPLTIDGEQGYCQVAVNAFYIFSTENDEDSLALLKWWMENNYEQWSVGEDYNIPARADYCEKLYEDNPLSLAFYEATLGSGRISMDCAPFDTQDETASDFDNTSVMGDVLSALLAGQSVEEAAQIGDTTVNDIYTKYGY